MIELSIILLGIRTNVVFSALLKRVDCCGGEFSLCGGAV